MSQLFQFPEICITEASAGSGKTYALARRYVQLLLKTANDNPQSFQNILAITFTNKASLEMKSRVLYFLKKIALNQLSQEEEKDFLGNIGLSSQRAGKIAFNLMELLIRHYHFFSIKTIDSFINALLAGCAFKINLSARFKIQRNSDDYLQQSLDLWIAQASQDAKIRKLLDEFVHQYLFLENRSGWFPKEELFGALRLLFSEFNTYQKTFLTFPVESGDLYLAKKNFLDLLREIHALSNPSMNKKFYEGLTQFLEQHPVSFDLDDLSRYFSYPAFPGNKNAQISPELEKVWSKAHKAAANLCLAESFGVFNPYVVIFEHIMDIFRRLCTQDDILFLQELNKKASTLIESGITVSELYYRLAVRFHHYLIDEFQDTSLSQWQNLFPLVQEALSTGGSLFYVGDKKQAIYSFRGGESGLFDELPKQIPNAPVNYEYLSKNWRSHKAIVQFNNEIFSKQNLEDFFQRRQDFYLEKDKSHDEIFFSDADIHGIQKTFEHSYQEIREDLNQGYVKIFSIEGKRKQERQDYIKQNLFNIISDASQRFEPQDIVVLTRTNGQVEEVTQWLLSQGISAYSERSSDIKNHPLIIEILDFLRFLNSPNDQVSFARILLGEIFSKASGISQESLRGFLFECRLKKMSVKDLSIYQEFKTKYTHVWEEHFEDFFSQTGIYPVYELVVSIYAKFHLHEFKEAQGFLMHFLELIKRREEFSSDLEGFIEYFDHLQNEERFVPIQSQRAIQVMTVHKAKGLEFPVVIIPFLEIAIQTSKSSDKALSYVLDVSDEGLRMLRLKKTYGRFNELLKDRYEKEYKDSLAIELNNIYVALTRAINELYVMVPERSANSINPAKFLIPDSLYLLGHKESNLKHNKEMESLPVLSTNLNLSWMKQFKEEALEDSDLQLKIRQQGIMMHFCLAQITRIDKDLSVIVAEVIELAKIKGFDIEDGSKLLNFLSRKDVRPFFEVGQDVEILCEQEMVNKFGDAKRIDRLMIFKDKVWIVDFKTSHFEQESHQKQIKEYENLIREIYPKHKVEGFLVYL